MSGVRLARRSVIAGLGTLGGMKMMSLAQAQKADATKETLKQVSALKAGAPTLEPVELPLHGPNGMENTLKAMRGSPYLLHVWATWCAPCKKELPALSELISQEGLTCPIVPVAIDSGSQEKVAAFMKQFPGMEGRMIWSTDKGAYKAWLKKTEVSIPVTHLIDAKGRLRATVEGGIDWGAKDASDQLKGVLASV